MPEEPATLAFVVGILYPQNWRKQELLTIETVPELFSHLWAELSSFNF